MRAFQISLFYINIENFITINWLIRLLKRTGRFFFMLVRAWPLYLWELLKAKRDWPCLSLGRYILNVKVRMISVKEDSIFYKRICNIWCCCQNPLKHKKPFPALHPNSSSTLLRVTCKLKLGNRSIPLN